MATILLLTLGNRDLQIKKDTPLARFFEQPPFHLRDDKNESWVFSNNDDDSTYILNKFHFITITKYLLDNHLNYLKERREDILFPMLDKTMEFAGQNQPAQVILSTSNQRTTDPQDCIHEAEIIKTLRDDLPIVINAFDFPPTHFEDLVNHYSHYFNKWENEGYYVIVSNAGGTPDMRAATHFAGFAQDIVFININARKGTWDSRTFKEQKQLVLSNTIESMLAVFDYEGLRKLPVEQTIIDEAQKALHLYNFTHLEQYLALDDKTSYELKAKKGINLLAENMFVSFQQGRYADVLGRIFRFEEAVWQYLFFTYLNKCQLIDSNEKVKRKSDKTGKIKSDNSFEKMLAQQEIKYSVLKSWFSEYLTETNGELYIDGVPVKSGKNFFYHFFGQMNAYLPVRQFFEPINKDEDGEFYTARSILNHLRNRSILGHGLEGISKEQLENLTGPFETFHNRVIDLCEKELGIQPYVEHFEEINSTIREHI